MKSLRKEKGFTLIELLVVVAIIGVLATIVLSSLGKVRDRVKDAGIKSTLSSMRTQAELILAETNSFRTVCDESSSVGIMFREIYTKYSSSDDSMPSHSSTAICGDVNSYLRITGNGSFTTGYAGGGEIIDSNGNLWAVSIQLSTGEWFCVDSSGNSVIRDSSTIVPWGNDLTC